MATGTPACQQEHRSSRLSLPSHVPGLFGLCGRLFGVEMVDASDEAPRWHPDVQFFKVLDAESREHVASFYLDPYARPEDKRGGAWMGACVGKSAVLDRKQRLPRRKWPPACRRLAGTSGVEVRGPRLRALS